MYKAARDGNLAELNLVVKFAPERVNEDNYEANSNSRSGTPLHCAAECDQEAAVSLLLSAKADVNKTTSYGRTPLYYAKGDRVRQLLRDARGH